MQHLPKSQRGAHPAGPHRGRGGGGGAWEAAPQGGPSKAALPMQVTGDGTFMEVSCFHLLFFHYKENIGTSLAWLRFHDSIAGGLYLIPGQGTKIPHARGVWPK